MLAKSRAHHLILKHMFLLLKDKMDGGFELKVLVKTKRNFIINSPVLQSVSRKTVFNFFPRSRFV